MRGATATAGIWFCRYQALVAAAVMMSLSAPSASAQQDSPEALAARWFDAVESAALAVAREIDTPETLVAAIGSDPRALLDWVRENTSLVAYAGALRGSTGVLADRMGNSLDRALLLARLVQVAGRQVRLAHGTLDEQTLETLLSRVAMSPRMVTSRAHVANVARDAASKSTPIELPAIPSAATVAQHPGELSAAIEEIDRQTSWILETVARAEPLLGFDFVDQPLRDHWWVEIEDGGLWVPLDPAGLAGDASAFDVPFAGHIDIDRTTLPAAVVPAELQHAVTVRLVIEKLDESRASEGIAVSHRLAPAVIGVTPVALTIEPRRDKLADVFAQAGSPIAQSAFASLDEWRPVIQVGPTLIEGEAFDNRGNLLESGAGRSTRGNTSGGFLSDALEELSEQLEFRPDGVLSAAWIEYELFTPGIGAATIRRELFDMVGPAKRMAGSEPWSVDETLELKLWRATALSDRITMLPMVAWSTPTNAMLADLSAIVSARKPVLDLATAGGNLADFHPPVEVHELHALSLARSEIASAERETFIDRINLLTTHNRLLALADGRFASSRTTDIVSNHVAALPGTSDPFAASVRQGVADTLAEVLAMGPGGGRHNAAVLGTYPDLIGDWRLVETPEQAGAIQAGPDVRERLHAAIRGGDWLIALDRIALVDGSSSYGWWQISPQDGTTLGTGHRGWGEGQTEYLIVVGLLSGCIVTSMLTHMSPTLDAMLRDVGLYEMRICLDAKEGRVPDTPVIPDGPAPLPIPLPTQIRVGDTPWWDDPSIRATSDPIEAKRDGAYTPALRAAKSFR